MIQAIRRLVFALVTLATCAFAQPSSAAPHLRMRLVVEGGAPQVGRPVTLALDTRPEPGWHGYWVNPGDAGLPASFDWTLPSGTRVGVWRWPVPTTLVVAGLMNFVYEAPYAPVITLVPPATRVGEAFLVRLHVQYLVCTTSLCVPEEQTLSLDAKVKDGVGSGPDPVFDRYLAALPRPLGGQASYQSDAQGLRISIPFPAAATLSDPYFFPAAVGIVDLAAPQGVARDGDRLLITTRAATGTKPAGVVGGVLRIGPGRGLSIQATPGVVASLRTTNVGWTALIAFAGAVLGGLILNVMPCVFPILSLKALSLARGGVGAREAREEALAYTAGVVIVCLALGGVILALRAGGSAVGWAFQLQHPAMIALLLLLSVAITLNLLGLFEVPMPRLVGERAGSGGAFATGALAAFVATPCSGPFMGAALGAALVLPWPAALGVFGGLGVGLALPFLLIGLVPALRKRLPKPGAWMATFRRVLAIPMALTALALCWVLWRLAGNGALALALAASVAVGLALAKGGRRQKRGRAFGFFPITVVQTVAVAAAISIAMVPNSAQNVPNSLPIGAERFSVMRLAAFRREGRPVFAYFTADWCLTCKVNEKAAIETDATRDGFARNKVAVLVGDWTDGNPALGRFIEAHNRAGVPLYLFYPKGGGEPRVLPQVLTPGMLAALGG